MSIDLLIFNAKGNVSSVSTVDEKSLSPDGHYLIRVSEGQKTVLRGDQSIFYPPMRLVPARFCDWESALKAHQEIQKTFPDASIDKFRKSRARG